MSEFLNWHPSSVNAERLYNHRDQIAKHIYQNPFKGIQYLQKQWRFGQVSESWDDFVFESCVRMVLDQNLKANIKESIRRYSMIDHALFLPYIRRQEDPIRFRRAFWNVNFYGAVIARKFERLSSTFNEKNNNSIYNSPENFQLSEKPKILFVLKGPYKLAHVEFLHNFLSGCNVFSKAVNVHLLLIDDEKSAPVGLNHISITSLSKYTDDQHKKLQVYRNFCLKNKFDHISWVAPIQNIALYMGMQLAPCQSYWSMKYHSIIMPSIQKYAGLGFGGNSFVFDDTYWFRGRAFPDLLMPKTPKEALESLKRKFSIPKDALIAGCFVRSEKLYEKQFWLSICKIISSSSKIHFVIASQSIPTQMQLFLKQNLGESWGRLHYLGWINTKEWVSNLDIYYDSYPRGSCNTIFEAIEKSVPVLMIDSSHNRESSALPYLLSAIGSESNDILISHGIFTEESDRLNAFFELIVSADKRNKLANKQSKVMEKLKGKNYLFAKDYLNYFLETKLTLKSLSENQEL